MSEHFKNSLLTVWLVVSAVCMTVPVFIPSNAFSADPAANAIGTATATMFILSFPSSVFGLPLLIFIAYSLGISPNSIEGMYLNLFLLFVLGSVQWFWVVPRVWRQEPTVQLLAIAAGPGERRLPDALAEAHFQSVDSQERTPIERVILDRKD